MIEYVLAGYEPHDIVNMVDISLWTINRTLTNFRKRARAVRDDLPVEKVPVVQQKYREAHKEELRAKQQVYAKRYREKNREKINARKRAGQTKGQKERPHTQML